MIKLPNLEYELLIENIYLNVGLQVFSKINK